MDTVDKYLCFLSADKLEDIKHNMFRAIIQSKVFQKCTFNNQYFMLAIDFRHSSKHRLSHLSAYDLQFSFDLFFYRVDSRWIDFSQINFLIVTK